MDAATFFGLERVPGKPTTWCMEVVPGLTSGTGALFGGCGLGAAIEVMEQLTGRPCVWATAQYLSFAHPPSVVELDALEVVRGHRISQACVIAHVGDTEILTVLGALGRRPLDLEGQWSTRPHVLGPARVTTARDDGSPRRTDREPSGCKARVRTGAVGVSRSGRHR